MKCVQMFMGEGRLLYSTLLLKLQSKELSSFYLCLFLMKYTIRKKELLSVVLHVFKYDAHNQISFLKFNYILRHAKRLLEACKVKYREIRKQNYYALHIQTRYFSYTSSLW